MHWWYLADWKKHLDDEKGRSNTDGISAGSYDYKLRFVETKAGASCSSSRLSSIRSWTRSIFETMQTDGKLIQKWTTETGHKDREAAYGSLECHFEELRLCDDHWKAQMLCQILFPTWRQSRPLVDSDDTSASNKRTRAASESGGSQSKKAKTSAPQDFEVDEYVHFITLSSILLIPRATTEMISSQKALPIRRQPLQTAPRRMGPHSMLEV